MIQWKRPAALACLAAVLVLAATGVWLWLLPHGAGAGGGLGRGGGSSLRHTLRDIHLYASWLFLPAVVLHVLCNGRAMLRHLGWRGGADGTRSPASPDTPPRR